MSDETKKTEKTPKAGKKSRAKKKAPERQAPLTVRLNNPGAIEKPSSFTWQGQADVQQHSRFCTFESPEMGARAMLKVLATYRRRYNRRTVESVIKRWAPAVENYTEGYIKRVCRDAVIDRTTQISIPHYPRVAWAMAIVEAGYEAFPLEVFEEGMKLAEPIRWHRG